MELTSEQSDHLSGHQWATLATGRKDGSPQVSLIGYSWTGREVLVTFRRSSAKRHNIARQPRVALLVADGRRALTLYGDAELLEQDPERVEVFEQILARFGAPATPRDELARRLDEEGRVVARISPTGADLHE
ncbi:MAG TPA: TIGR03618 family F420-dependent PPOX class oxidoreductase [Acidimicrobiia bacterium]|nr:TIGR03618 family F420-dependent PPOX class oxidoreductase [Acidimicrobiia bacterium]